MLGQRYNCNYMQAWRCTCLRREFKTFQFHTHFLTVHFHMHNLLGNSQVQTANCQWLLTLELHQLTNPKNAVKWYTEFCCCDFTECHTNLENLNGCNNSCNALFFISVSHCLLPSSCSIYTPTWYDTESKIILDFVSVFVLNDSSDQVSVNTHTHAHTHTHKHTHTHTHT